MDMSGEQRIPAPQQAVWDALNDPEVLKLCIPGCESVERTADNQFTAKVVMAVGPVKAKFGGEVTLENIDAPNGYTIVGKGSGGAAGFGKGSAKVALRTEGSETVLSYTANASVGGKLAQIGSRLIDSTAKKLADEFFNRFVAHVSKAHAGGDSGGATSAQASVVEPAPAPAVAPASVPNDAPAVAQDPSGSGKFLWIGLAVVAAAAVIWYVTR